MNKEKFYENVMNWVYLKLEITDLEYDTNEKWFIKLIDQLHDICPKIDYLVTANFVIDAWRHKKKDELIEQREMIDYLDYPDFHEHI